MAVKKLGPTPKMIEESDVLESWHLNFDTLREMVDKYSTMENSFVEIESGYDYGDGLLCFRGKRPETDDEKKKRLDVARIERERKAAQKEQIRQAEIKQLRALAAKYPEAINA